MLFPAKLLLSLLYHAQMRFDAARIARELFQRLLRTLIIHLLARLPRFFAKCFGGCLRISMLLRCFFLSFFFFSSFFLPFFFFFFFDDNDWLETPRVSFVLFAWRKLACHISAHRVSLNICVKHLLGLLFVGSLEKQTKKKKKKRGREGERKQKNWQISASGLVLNHLVLVSALLAGIGWNSSAQNRTTGTQSCSCFINLYRAELEAGYSGVCANYRICRVLRRRAPNPSPRRVLRFVFYVRGFSPLGGRRRRGRRKGGGSKGP